MDLEVKREQVNPMEISRW
uniref:Uncharacterized protein n=1 Tax=Timema tahoe TaxID=61484 RepID=A0A7R9IKV9_9NEOP|nr:unnamed protein product [Timema tahoe]